MIKKWTLIPALLLILTAGAQDKEPVNTLFPGELAVVKEHTVHYTIRLKDGVPEARSKEHQEILYLSENAGSHMSKFSYYHSSFHPVEKYEAYTETPGGKKIQVKEFKTSQSVSASVFYDDVKQTNFDFPNITPGSSGHLELEKTHTNPQLLSPHYFSRGIPTLSGELKITFPKDMTVKYMIRGNDKDKVQFTSDTRKGETTYTFAVKNLAKDMNYPDAPDNAWYSLHVIFWIENYQSGGQTVSYMANLDNLYQMAWGFVKDINKSISPELKAITDSITNGLSTNEQKARGIYKWVQKNIKYVAFEEGMEGFIPREANLVCSRRFGDCKDMSSILTVMLNYAGVPAYYTWIGTRSLPYDYTEVHLTIVDNHMITAVRLDTGYIFLDGTDAHCVFGAPSGHIQGKQALIGINDKEYKIVRVPELARESSRLTDTTILDLTDKGILGTVKVNMTGYFAMDMHGVMSYTNEKDREKYMKGYFNRGSNKFKVEEEKYSAYQAGLKRVEYKLAYNVSRKTNDRLFTWDELAKRVYSNYTTVTDKETKKVNDLISDMKVKNLATDAEKIAAVEHYLKTKFATREDIGGEDAMNLEKVIKSKLASYVGIVRLYSAIFRELGITHEFVLAGDRNKFTIEKNFENWNNADNSLIYFPGLKKFIAPTLSEYRYPWIDPVWGGINAFYCKSTKIGEFNTAFGEVRMVPLEDYSKSMINIDAEVTLNKTMDTVLVSISQIYAGYPAATYRAIFNYNSEENIKLVTKEMITFGTNSENVVSSKVENKDFESYNQNKPFILTAVVKASELMERAGNKLIIKIGDIIGPQVEMYQ